MMLNYDTRDISLSSLHPSILYTYLVEKGFSSKEIVSGTRINIASIQSSDSYVSHLDYKALIIKAVELLKDPSFGLDFGKRLNITGHGQFGLGALACETLQESFEFARQTSPILNPLVNLEYHQDDRYFHIHLKENVPWDETEPYMVDTFFSMATALVDILTPNLMEQLRYQHRYAAIPNESTYKLHYKGKVEFNTEKNQLSLPLLFIQRTSPWRNPSVVSISKAKLEEDMKNLNDPKEALLGSIADIILATPGKTPSIEDVATHFHISSRTLNRRLKALQTSYKELVVQIKTKKAMEYLSNPQVSIDQISYALGYKDASNFSKAFRTWTHLSPSEYRERLNGSLQF